MSIYRPKRFRLKLVMIKCRISDQLKTPLLREGSVPIFSLRQQSAKMQPYSLLSFSEKNAFWKPRHFFQKPAGDLL